MWLLLRLVLEFLGRSAAWLAAVAALAGVAALLVALATRRPARAAWPVLATAAVVGALAGASLAYRFGWPEAWRIGVWGRSLPLAWTVGGALLGAGAAVLWDRLRAHYRHLPQTPAPA
jgi:hypothetical protein